MASFNVENLFPVGKENDGHVITQPEYDERVHALVQAIRHRLREPDVVAVQEVAVFADGANALPGLAAALGNYTGYIATNNDERGIATGFLVKHGTTATNGRLIGKDVVGAVGERQPCATCFPGKLFDRAPYALDIRKGDLSFTALSNHWASQSHQTRCRIDEAAYVRDEVAELQQSGRNVLVAGDLNDFEFSTPLATLTQGDLLTNLWYDVPAGQAYSYKFNGHLQTLDHIVVTAGLKSRLKDMRYVHFDNDVYERTPTDGTGISDHDPPLATFEAIGASTSVPGGVSGTVPATLALSLGPPGEPRHVRAGRRRRLHGDDDRDRHVDRRRGHAERPRPEHERPRPAGQWRARAAATAPGQRQRRRVRTAADRQRPADAADLRQPGEREHRHARLQADDRRRPRACAPGATRRP